LVGAFGLLWKGKCKNASSHINYVIVYYIWSRSQRGQVRAKEEDGKRTNLGGIKLGTLAFAVVIKVILISLSIAGVIFGLAYWYLNYKW
jgi:hypothetical protein